MNKKIGKLLIIQILLLPFILWLIIFFTDNGSDDYLEEYIAEVKALQIKQDLHGYLDPIINGAKVMTYDRFLQDWLESESDYPSLSSYLDRYVDIIGCVAIELTSVQTEIVYRADGTRAQMSPEDDRDLWYYNFQKSEKDVSTELFYDSLEGNLYIYYNRKIFNSAKQNIGILGFLIRYDQITEIMSKNAEDGLEVYFTDYNGEILIHQDQSRIGSVVIYDYYGLLQHGEDKSSPVLLNELEKKGHYQFVYEYSSLGGYLVIIKNLSVVKRTVNNHSVIVLLFIFSLIILNGFLYLFFINPPGRRNRKL